MPVSIKGKEYVTVAERVELLRQSGKSFEIVESMPIQIGERCAWRVAVVIDGSKFYGSAECHFNAKPGTADATDPFACGETSAIGRALGFAGFGAVDSIASADEIVRTEPSIESMKDLKAKARNRTYKLGVETLDAYEKFCARVIGKKEPETLVDINAINAACEQKERKAS